MAGWKFTIIKDKHALRCEVCHQADLFEPASGICRRCQPLPIAELANQDRYSFHAIPASPFASAIAAMFAFLTFLAGVISLHVFFRPHSIFWLEMESLPRFLSLLALNIFNLPLSLALNRWCSDRYNERLRYRVVVWGRICSVVGLSGAAAGIYISVPRLLNLFH